MITKWAVAVSSVIMSVCAACAADQLWNDGGADNTWSTSDLNWDAGTAWVNGSSAVFAGSGETVEVANAVSVANLTFQGNGYVIADADNNGTLTFAGLPSVVTVVNAGDTGAVSEVIAGGGFTKAGPGLLRIQGANTYTGVTTVSAGILRLQPATPTGLGAVGAGNHTVVENGATLDLNSANSVNMNEDVIISGSGVNGIGALVNLGATTYYNTGIRNLTLAGDATLGGPSRTDLGGHGTFAGNGFTLTKAGAFEVAVSRAVNGSPIVINAGTYTVQHADALGGATAGDTTLNGGKLQAWGSYTLSERLIVNGGTLCSSGTSINTLRLTGNMTLNSNVTVQTEASITNTVELAGVMDGPGGFTRSGNGYVYVMGDANTYAGPTTVSGGSRLWVGKAVGGTGRLGPGAVTNNGTLYANSPVLGAGEVVNNAGCSLYLNPPLLDVGSLVNKGTVYGTSVLQTASGVANSGTWNAYSGVFGAGVLTNSGTLNLYTNVFTYGQFVNSGTLSLWMPVTLADPVTFNGGSVYVNDMSNTLYVTGPVTVGASAAFGGTASSVTEISGRISGPGGLTRSGDGLCFVTGDSNDYAGPTTVNLGRSLWVGKPAGAASGRLGPGAITNNGTLYFDSAGAYTAFSGINGSGLTAIRYGGQVTVSGGVSSNSDFHVANGSLTLTNGAVFSAYNQMTIANRADAKYGVAPANCLLPTNVLATVTVNAGCALIVRSVTFGNGGDLAGGMMTGILNQAGGLVRTTAASAEGNGVRLGHYPQTRSFYNMMGGTLIVEGNYDLGCATDGQGWFNMTGGEVFATRVMLNERHDAGGFGRLTVAGGVMNIGSLDASVGPATNAITADVTAPYLVEYGGAGGMIRAVTNIFLPLNAKLSGTGANAITFDTTNFAISLSGNLTGAGGLNKAGAGELTLSGTNTYSGATRVLAGTLAPASDKALPAGGVVAFGVAADGSCGRLRAAGDLSLAGLTVAVANPELLDRSRQYTIVTYGGALSGMFGAQALPEPWYVYYDWEHSNVQLRSSIGTLIKLR